MNWVSKVINHSRSLSISIFLITPMLFAPVHVEAAEADPGWHTFLGSQGFEEVSAVAIDDTGNTFIAGESARGWGDPLVPWEFGHRLYAGMVAKVNAAGELQWHTFLGGDNGNFTAITLDEDGNIYVTGAATAWGSPLNAHTGRSDILIMKLNSAGTVQWHTFFGSTDADKGLSITLDADKNILVTGSSSKGWGTPISPNTNNNTPDIFVLKLNPAGALQWNTFYGAHRSDRGNSIVADVAGNIYVAGNSAFTWGSPVRPHSGHPLYAGVSTEGVVLKLNGAGALQWHTFLGSIDPDNATSIALDETGQLYVTGSSYSAWSGLGPNPLNAHTAGDNYDFYLAKLNNSGSLMWYTFYGSTVNDDANSVAIDCNGDIFVAGLGGASWGSPVNDFSGGNSDFNILKLNAAGGLLWQTFEGSTGTDIATALATNSHGFLTVAGKGQAWGDPVNDNAGQADNTVIGYPDATSCFRVFRSSFE